MNLKRNMLGVGVATATLIFAVSAGYQYRQTLLLAVVIVSVVLTAGYLAYVDFCQYRLPNLVTGPLALFATGGLVLCGFSYDVTERTLPAIGLGAGTFIFFLLLHLLVNLGMGDVKYAYTVGLVSGWFGLATLLVAFAVTVIAAAFAAVIAAAVTGNSKRFIAYGPYLSLGLAVALL